MTIPLFAIQVGLNSYIERGWYRVAAENEERALNSLMHHFNIPNEKKDELNVIDNHKSSEGIIFW